MKIIKHIPEAQLAVAELDDGTRLTISADSLAAEASEGLAGTLRYRVAEDASYLEAVMQTGAETWEWVVLKTNSWAE